MTKLDDVMVSLSDTNKIFLGLFLEWWKLACYYSSLEMNKSRNNLIRLREYILKIYYITAIMIINYGLEYPVNNNYSRNRNVRNSFRPLILPPVQNYLSMFQL